MPLKSVKHHLVSGGIGRRLIVLFVLAATVPLSLLAFYALSKVSSELRTLRQAELVQSSKNYGATLIGRLAEVEDLLQASAQVDDPQQSIKLLTQHVGRELAGAAVKGKGRILATAGDINDIQKLGLKSAGPMVMFTNGKAVVYWVLATRVGGTDYRIVVKLRNEFLWGSVDELPSATDIIVVNEEGKVLHQSQPFSEGTSTLLQKILKEGEHRGVSAIDDGNAKHQYIGYWRLPPGRLGQGEYLVAAGQPAAYTDAAIQSFNSAFIPIVLLSAMAAALLALTQIRRLLEPLGELKSAAERLSNNDFSATVSAKGTAEFAAMGEAFNSMANKIGQQLSILNRHAEIDRIVLTTLDIPLVIEKALREILSITRLPAAAICVHGEDGHSWHRYALSADRATVQQESFSVTEPDNAGSDGVWLDTAGIEARSAYVWKSSARFILVRAIEDRSRRLGTLLLSQAAPLPLDDGVGPQLDGLLDRVAIALIAAHKEQLLQQQAGSDFLTGLPNRRSFLEKLEETVHKAIHSGEAGSLLFLDLDQFKRTNDVLGHLAGDSLLKMAAERLQAALRSGDFIARLGGDEFTIIRPATKKGDLDSFCSSLIEDFSKSFDIEERSIFIGLSIGSVQIPADGKTALDLLRRADTAMYHAKKTGGQAHAAFHRSMEKEIQESLALDQALRDALDHDQLLLHYQIQISANGESVLGAEALVRWILPDGSVRNPMQWIPYAEETHLIHRVGAWVLNNACRQIRLWDEAGLHVDRVAVNITARQLEQKGFYFEVLNALERAGIAPHRLELEITESQLMASPEISIALLKRFADMGISIAVDDFGTGYSSFGQLRHMPLSILKIDRSLVCDVDDNEKARAIVLAIIQMAHALGYKVIAEGIETPAEHNMLKELGCDGLQGYSIGMPIPADLFLRSYAKGAGKPVVPARLQLVSSKDSKNG